MVRACIAHDAGERAESWTMAVPSRMVEVRDPNQVSGLNASDP